MSLIGRVRAVEAAFGLDGEEVRARTWAILESARERLLAGESPEAVGPLASRLAAVMDSPQEYEAEARRILAEAQAKTA